MKYDKTVESRWFNLIVGGRKTLEGRLNKGNVVDMKEGDTIEIHEDGTENSVHVRVSRVDRFSSIQQFFDNASTEDIERCLPGVKREDFVKTYRKFYSEEDEHRYGFAVIEITLDVKNYFYECNELYFDDDSLHWWLPMSFNSRITMSKYEGVQIYSVTPGFNSKVACKDVSKERSLYEKVHCRTQALFLKYGFSKDLLEVITKSNHDNLLNYKEFVLSTAYEALKYGAEEVPLDSIEFILDYVQYALIEKYCFFNALETVIEKYRIESTEDCDTVDKKCAACLVFRGLVADILGE